METETQKHKIRKDRDIWYKEDEETETKRVGLGILSTSMRVHT